MRFLGVRKQHVESLICYSLLAIVLQSCGEMASLGLKSDGFKEQNTLELPDHNGLISQDKLKVDDMILDVGPAFDTHDHDGNAHISLADGFEIYGSKPWKDGIMPIEFDSAIPEKGRAAVLRLCNDEWGATSSVRCILRTSESNYLHISMEDDESIGSMCSSQVGAGSNGGRREMNLGSKCWYASVVLHELGHALGFMHEHQRPDRDQYLEINFEDVPGNLRHSLQILSIMGTSSPYDFDSIMHYGWLNISGMKARPEYEGRLRAQSTELSEQDRVTVAKVYPKSKSDDPNPEPTPGSTPDPGPTPKPTATPVPTATPKPTSTPRPTPIPLPRAPVVRLLEVLNYDDYRALNPDLASFTGVQLSEHWAKFGIKEGRSASTLFSVKDYLSLYPDVRQAFGSDLQSVVNHYVTFGFKEGRIGRMSLVESVFDYNAYRTKNPDLASMSEAQLRRHWVIYGIKEGRVASSQFSVRAYVEKYSDVRAYSNGDYEKAIAHWVMHGKNEGRSAPLK